MAAPQRIQRKRTKGWRMPEGTLYVGRPTKWGNPYTPSNYSFILDTSDWRGPTRSATTAECVAMYREELTCGDVDCHPDEHPWTAGLNLEELRGYDLACWCPLDQPCHADVLLELANV